MASTIASTSVLAATNGAIRSLSMMQHRQPMIATADIASGSRNCLFGDAAIFSNHTGAKVQMNLNPRYISKVKQEPNADVDEKFVI